MTEPETITLRRLPPEHVLRKGVDVSFRMRQFAVMLLSNGMSVEQYGYPCYCRAEDYPPEYDKPAEPTKLQLEEGKRYVCRDGSVTEPLRVSNSINYPFEAKVEGIHRTWTTNGLHDAAIPNGTNEVDIVSEYVDPVTAIDPGEGWRIYDQDTEGLEPRPDAEYYHGGKWKKRSRPYDRMVLGSVYRVPITPQPDRLTELRQQGERQAKRIVDLEASEKELLEKSKKADDLAHIVLSTYDGFNAQITQRDEQIAGLRARVKELEATARPLRWERRMPTEEECRERWIALRDQRLMFAPGMLTSKEWADSPDQICIFPHIAEPEPKMITQRRWLVHNGSHIWEEVWLKDCEGLIGHWSERIRTRMTREVPE